MSLTSPYIQKPGKWGQTHVAKVWETPDMCLSLDGKGQKGTPTHQFLKEVSPGQRVAGRSRGLGRRQPAPLPFPAPHSGSRESSCRRQAAAFGLSFHFHVSPQQQHRIKHACGWPCVTE